jgi:hypothetical protein
MNSPPPKPDKGLLENIFPPRRIPQDQIGGCNPELRDYRRDFGNRNWQEVSDEAYVTHSDVYCLMDPETLVHYIAGFMRHSLSADGYFGPEFLIYFAGSDRFCGFCRLLTSEQLRYVIAFIDHYISNEWYSTKEREDYQKNRRSLLQGSLDES